MTEQPDNLVLELLRSIRFEIGELRAETNLKIGTLAEGMVSMRKEINLLGKRVDDLTTTVEGLRTDVRMIALAVDEHTNRLDKIEAHFPITH